MELFTTVWKQFLYTFLVSMDKIPKSRQVLYGNFRSISPFLLHSVSGYWEATSLSASEILPHSSLSENANKLLQL